ncbi:MAG TPA: tRNA pseudouridine(38-40) synthase TruA [Bacilli bacterium]|nr:tRNA pseudouridine(38-40) synthase TruA [Bacilli bacterium]
MRYKCVVSYDGSNYHGFQVQGKLRTVQKEIEDVLAIITKKPVIIHSSGRTDTGVHALGQVFHFDCDLDIGNWNMKTAINSRIAKDIYIKSVEKVTDDFHSRINAIKKEYHYMIDFNEFDPLLRNYRYFCRYRNIDRSLMEEAAKLYIGEHDFRSYTKNKKNENTVREIFSIEFIWNIDVLKIKIIGSGFLHNMIRILVAMWLETARGKYSLEDLKAITAQKNRVFAPKIAPAEGLYLYKVYY